MVSSDIVKKCILVFLSLSVLVRSSLGVPCYATLQAGDNEAPRAWSLGFSAHLYWSFHVIWKRLLLSVMLAKSSGVLLEALDSTVMILSSVSMVVLILEPTYHLLHAAPRDFSLCTHANLLLKTL